MTLVRTVTTIPAVIALGLSLSGCVAYEVASTAVDVTASVAGTVVGTAVDVTGAVISAPFGHDDTDKKSKK
jgi:hypothetical protein